jgi:hypothetical protein
VVALHLNRAVALCDDLVIPDCLHHTH